MAAGVGEAVVSGVASKVAESMFDTIKRQISYVFKYQSYMDDLKNQVKDLEHRREMVEVPVNLAKTQGDEIYKGVQDWLISVNKFTADEGVAKSITAHEDAAKKLCFKGLYPNLFKRYNLSRKAVKAAKDCADLLGKGNFSNVSYRPDPVRSEVKNVVRDYQQFDSRMTVFQNVMEVLKDSKVNMIGVYGMGGVGKTTLVKEVRRQAMEEKLFHEVAMAEVTQTPDLKTIQDKIAYDLGLSFDMHENVHERAGRLCKRLKNENRVLVILDNIWAKLDLETVGIPYGVDEQGKCCSVLLTSRSQHLLCNEMNSQKNFSVEVLSDEESMGLFWKTVGDHDSTQTSDFQTLAVEVVRKCGGLPIAIETVAVALKNKSLPVWKDALNQLKNSNPRHIRGMTANVYSSIQLSYNFLESADAKSLFRLCALQNDGSQIPINDLMIFGMGLGWFKNCDTVRKGRNRVHALIDNLKTSCLLLDGDNEHVVKMHDVIHDVAVSIASEEHMFNIQDVDDLKEELEKVMQKDPTAISLPYREIQELPERLECPKLELFLLFAKSEIEGNSLLISDLFFEGMKQLRVLHLTSIWFSSSLGCLTNLRTLSLNYFNSREDVAIIGKLTKLQILSFRNSNIEQLPLEIGQLTRLKLLDLSNCRSLEVIAPNVISKLSRLEELYMGNSFTHWEKGEGGSNASLDELKALSKLTTLDLHIPNVRVMPQDLVAVELERYKIRIGGEGDIWDGPNLRTYERVLKLNGLDKSIILRSGMQKLLKNIEYLRLHNLNGFQNVVNSVGQEISRTLSATPSASKEIVAEDDPEDLMTVLFNNKVIFPALEKLVLDSLNMEKIWLDPFPTMSTSPCQNLTELMVKNCSRLKFLFTYSMVKSLVRLQKLVIQRCESMERVIDTTGLSRDEEQMIDSDIFPKLEYLELWTLPKLTRFMSMSSSDSEEINIFHTGTQSTLFDKKHHQLTRDSYSKLKILIVCGCNKVEMLFASLKLLSPKTDGQQPVLLFDLDKVRLPSLEKLEIWHMENLRKIWQWHPQLTLDSFGKLKELDVVSCHKLTSIFLSNIITGKIFPRLEFLKVINCNSIEEIIEEAISSSSSSRRFDVFSQLIEVKLELLPKLKSIYQGIHILEWHALKDLYVKGCHKMEILFASSELLESQQHIILVDHHKVVFPNLKTLKVKRCNGLRNLVTLSTAESQVKLARMKISDCKIIEKIIDVMVGKGVKENPIVFSQLQYLELYLLPTLESFCLENYTLKFPYLEQVIVSACTSMKAFSEGVLDTPMLHKVQLRKGKRRKEQLQDQWEERWEGNLNSTIRKMFQGMDRFCTITDLKLSEFPSLKEIWDGPTLPVSFFSNLTSLVVDDCTFMSSAIPANLLRFLNNLFYLEVRNCDSIEEVFHLEDLNADEVRVFPALWILKLVDLPKLKRLCNYTGNMIKLNRCRKLWIENCPNMETCISNFTPAHMTANIEPQEMISDENFLTDIQPFFDEKVDFLHLHNLKLFKLPKLLQLENSHPKYILNYLEILEISECHKLRQLVPSSTTFKCLTTLEVSKCDGLINLTTLSTAKSLANLTRMNVNDCKMIEEIIQQEVGEEAEKDCIVFNKLQYLGLSCLPSLTSFCLGNYTLEFPSLEHVFVKECPKMEIFSRGVLSTPKLELDSEEEERWEGSLNFAIQKLFQEMNSKEEN